MWFEGGNVKTDGKVYTIRLLGQVRMVKALRSKKFWTQSQMANAMEVTERTVQNWEEGRTRMRKRDLDQLARMAL
jgi:DNA-binding transcriptional regulator YiaG